MQQQRRQLSPSLSLCEWPFSFIFGVFISRSSLPLPLPSFTALPRAVYLGAVP